MLSDISSEMVTSILPLFLTFQLRFTALQFGLVDGIGQGATAVVRMVGGIAADRTQRHKEVAAIGYGTSAACRLGLLAAGGSWLAVTGVQLADRTGKGIRVAPRDALISFSSTPERLGRSFGIHRSLDTIGALLGPLLAFAVLQVAPRDFEAVLVISFCFAVLGLGVLVLLVEPPQRPVVVPDAELRGVWRDASALLRDPAVRRIVLAGSTLGLVTISDSFIYLLLQERTALTLGFFPLLFAGTATSYLLLAVPVGRLADKIGRAQVFLAGHGALMGAYAVLWAGSSSDSAVIAVVLLLGTYYAATDGVLMAMASSAVPPRCRTSGLALVGTTTSLTRLIAAVVFGLLWVRVGAADAVGVFIVALCASAPVAWMLLRRSVDQPLPCGGS